MRKLNMALVAAMLVSFLAHAIMGSMRLFGGDSAPVAAVAWVTLALAAAHVVVTTVLTAQTLHARRRSGAGYFRDNKLFWIRRISGFAILIPLVMHLVIFRSANADVYRLQVFTAGRMISQILLVLAIALHVLTNIRPALIGLGVKDTKAFTVDLLLVLSVLLLMFAAAFAVYYVRWAAV